METPDDGCSNERRASLGKIVKGWLNKNKLRKNSNMYVIQYVPVFI